MPIGVNDLKVLIVEDEIKTLNGVEYLIHQISEEYIIVGKATNAKDAIEIAMTACPDVIITDIQMPGMTGLEMIQVLNQKQIRSKFIILSGYAEFDYARKAVELRSVDYLLKPITKSLLAKALDKVKHMIEEQKNENNITVLSNQELIKKVIALPPNESGHYQKELPKRYKEDEKFSFLLIRGDNKILKIDENRMMEIIKRTISVQYEFYCVTAEHRQMYVLYKGVDKESLYKQINQVIYFCREEIHAYLAFCVTDFCGITKLLQSKQQLIDYSNWNLSMKSPALIDEEKIRKFHCHTLVYPNEIEQRLLYKIEFRQFENLTELEDFVEYLYAKEYAYMDIREAMICLTISVLYVIRKTSYGLYENVSNLKVLEWINELLFAQHYISIMNNIIFQYKIYINNTSQNAHPLIRKVIKIVDQEYKTEFNLEELARRVNVTPEYLSSLFVKELGVKFTTYYTQKRIESAKDMLKSGNYKVYEVAHEHGYEDVKYFCKVFKKYVGISPREYQQMAGKVNGLSNRKKNIQD
jgi:YesN/AraC family two-component response regulator